MEETTFPMQQKSGFASEKGRRSTMEDACTHHESERFNFWAVYDGHGIDKKENGYKVANEAANKLHQYVFEELGQLKTLDQSTMNKNILLKAFQKMETELRQQGSMSTGSTATVALLDKVTKTLNIANLGDSRAVLAHLKKRQIKTTALSTDHKAGKKREAERIRKAGGIVFRNRVSGILAVSRTLGDFGLKTEKSDIDKVMSEPEISVRQLGPNDRFLILACDGVWDVMTNQDAATLVNTVLEKTHNPTQAAYDLVQEALARNTNDNITAVIVEFQNLQ